MRTVPSTRRQSKWTISSKCHDSAGLLGTNLPVFSKTCLSQMVYGASPSNRSELSLITLLTRAEPMPQDSHKDKI
jgi:hypothetical protein